MQSPASSAYEKGKECKLMFNIAVGDADDDDKQVAQDFVAVKLPDSSVAVELPDSSDDEVLMRINAAMPATSTQRLAQSLRRVRKSRRQRIQLGIEPDGQRPEGRNDQEGRAPGAAQGAGSSLFREPLGSGVTRAPETSKIQSDQGGPDEGCRINLHCSGDLPIGDSVGLCGLRARFEGSEPPQHSNARRTARHPNCFSWQVQRAPDDLLGHPENGPGLHRVAPEAEGTAEPRDEDASSICAHAHEGCPEQADLVGTLG